MNLISRFNYLIVLIIVSTLLFIVAGILLQVNTERTISRSHDSNIRAIHMAHIDGKIQNIITAVVIYPNPFMNVNCNNS